MKRRLLSAAIASIGMSSGHRMYRSYSWGGGPCVPVSPMVSKERRCAQCHVGIVSGRHCFKHQNSKRK